jgi:hypothetical protein
MIHGDIVGYFGKLLHEQSKAPSFKLNVLFPPQLEQKALFLLQLIKIEARDISKKLV